ncbi:MAG: hypothetical protein ABIQ35_06740 [Verrucomicrobiota bacterium]
MKQNVTSYRIINCRTQLLGVVILVVLMVGGILAHHWISYLISIICAVFAVISLFFQEVQIDAERGQIIEAARFLAIAPVWKRVRTADDFSGIRCYRDYQDEGFDSWLVDLLPHTGKAVDIRRFSTPTNEDCLEAKKFAQELSETTNLKLI